LEEALSIENNPSSEERPEERGRSNFIRAIIDEDLRNGKHDGRVLTRFPPEPNGYLHIGHAKSICLNFGVALDYKGHCNLRFDDTNPAKEDQEYVDSIIADVKWLGFDPGEKIYFASDYFEAMYGFAVELIERGLAYVCSLSREEIQEGRGTIYEPGTESPYRARSVEENLDLFRRMRAGEFAEGSHVLRAKIDMASPNMLMRDPLLYRIKHAHHHRTGDTWCIYPMYDFAHCLEDALEGITHSLCTLEFESNRELYDWVLDHVSAPCHPQQLEFARLALGYTVMSKRNLLSMVTDKLVDGWDDPRMPTLAGLRRRGVTPEAIRAFAELIGVAKANSTVDIGKLEYCLRDDLNHRAPRVMAVLDPLKVVITNYPEDSIELLEASYWPHDVPKEGSREVPFSRELYIERADFMEEAPKKWHRLAPGVEVRLRYAYYVTCDEVLKDASGKIVELRCTYDPATRGGTAPDGRKVKGTLHWVSAARSCPAEVRLYDRLFKVERPGVEHDYLEDLNPASLITMGEARVEESLGSALPGEHYQFERQGFFFSDPVEHTAGRLVFNRVVSLKDSWAKFVLGEEAPLEVEVPKPMFNRAKDPERDATIRMSERQLARIADPELDARYERYTSELGLASHIVELLTGDSALTEFFEATLKVHPAPESVSKWMVNELFRELKTRSLDRLPFGPVEFGKLVALADAETITLTAAKEVFETLLAEGGDPQRIAEVRGLGKVGGNVLDEAIRSVMEANAEAVTRYRAGEQKLFGFLLGQVMRMTKGAADSNDVRKELTKNLQ